MKPLVSILIAAYNAEKTIAYTLRSAIAQTWPRIEIIVIDDGSKDKTVEIIQKFKNITVVSTENRGLSAALNIALERYRGDYLQYLDADDLLSPDKIERQLEARRPGDSPRMLLSSPWAHFYYRTRNAQFVQNPLCQDLSPVEWLLRKLGEDCHMQNATWLVAREVAEKAGPWDASLAYDQDGEYFTRVLLASDGVRFVPGTGIYYRVTGMNSVSFIGNSNKKKDSLLRSIKAHIQYIRSLEDSERVRKACLVYLQKYYAVFYPERTDLIAEMQQLAAQLGGHLKEPSLRWKYNWLRGIVGYPRARDAQFYLPQLKASLLRSWDQALFHLERSLPQSPAR
jgi:glycosyltransferase involved in cell wall biosynthesis